MTTESVYAVSRGGRWAWYLQDVSRRRTATADMGARATASTPLASCGKASRRAGSAELCAGELRAGRRSQLAFMHPERLLYGRLHNVVSSTPHLMIRAVIWVRQLAPPKGPRNLATHTRTRRPREMGYRW